MAAYDGQEFKKNWSGLTADANLWDIGQSGNWHSFPESANDKKMPKGEYILQVRNTWSNALDWAGYGDLKNQTLRIASPVKVAFENMSKDDAIKSLSMGKVGYSVKGSCPAYNSRSLGPNKSLAEYAALAKAKGATQFMHALDQPQWGAYWCEKGAFTPNPNDWSGL